MYCRECGTKNMDNSAFCEACGAKLIIPRKGVESNRQHEGQRNSQPNKLGPKPNKALLVIVFSLVLIIGIIALSPLFRGGQTTQPDEPAITENPIVEQENEPEPETEVEEVPELIGPEETENTTNQQESVILDGVVLTHPMDIEVLYQLLFILEHSGDLPQTVGIGRDGQMPPVMIGYMYGTPGIDMHMEISAEITNYNQGFEISYIRFYDNSVLEAMQESVREEVERISNISHRRMFRGVLRYGQLRVYPPSEDFYPVHSYKYALATCSNDHGLEHMFRGTVYYFHPKANVLLKFESTLDERWWSESEYLGITHGYLNIEEMIGRTTGMSSILTNVRLDDRFFRSFY